MHSAFLIMGRLIQVVQRGSETGSRGSIHREDRHHHPDHRTERCRQKTKGGDHPGSQENHTGQGQGVYPQTPEVVRGVQRKFRLCKCSPLSSFEEL